MQGIFFLAWSKRSRTRDAPTPTNISTKSEPEIEKKGTFASPATAFANKVLPVPGGPTRRTPLGILAPISVNFLGFFKKSTISCSSCFSSSAPATSTKRTLLLAILFAFVLPKSIALLLTLALLLIMNKRRSPPTMRTMIGTIKVLRFALDEGSS